MAESRPLGFDALKNEDEPAGYTVQFTPSEDPEPQTPDGDKKDQSEEIGLLERSSEREVLTSPTEEEKVSTCRVTSSASYKGPCYSHRL